ncbi:Hypothetical protein LUCI_3750 [Lucifera butyrica]|uniref:Uncharacterized protein n=1 Tax=Lucifera butyrica TaxID=1351585 RepID=A0A498RH66_9FIRM|nr:hypothetical protein [Lucifera butyrica]VBB08478.1 Hypothetical protein LUCI_3750 [Lucifera butyrica]
MARNSGGFTRLNVGAEVEEEESAVDTEKAEKAFLKGADMRKSANLHSKAGRKPKDVKADKPKRVYLTADQSKKVDAYCESIGLDFSPLVRQLLLKEGII